MSQIENNTVEAKNQLKTDISVFFENKDGKGKRILFVGNSITCHGYKDEIGWYGDNYGMAASCKEKDYVHLVMAGIRKKDPDAVLCIAQISPWEIQYETGSDVFYRYETARDFAADIIVFRLSENCSIKDFRADAFYREYGKLVDYLNVTGNATILLTTSFWKCPADAVVQEIGQERGYPTLYLGDLGEDDTMKAIGLFEHRGVAHHPGDKGMFKIAHRILTALQDMGMA